MQLNRSLCAGALALAAAAASPAAFAAPCVGFTDVDDSSAFCANVEWVKNRSITLGCTSSTLYCPGDSVTRLQMAAFLNRLGTALTPAFIRKRQTGAQLGALNYSSTQTVCRTDPVAPSIVGFDVNGYPRTAIVTGLLNVFTPDGPFDLQAQLVFSTDNGVTWQSAPAGDGFAYGSLYATSPGSGVLFAPPFDISLRPFTFFDLNVGFSYRFALQGLRTAGTGSIATTYCELHVQIVNRNGASSPLDPAQDGAPPGR